jgi:hypothetical protein
VVSYLWLQGKLTEVFKSADGTRMRKLQQKADTNTSNIEPLRKDNKKRRAETPSISRNSGRLTTAILAESMHAHHNPC